MPQLGTEDARGPPWYEEGPQVHSFLETASFPFKRNKLKRGSSLQEIVSWGCIVKDRVIPPAVPWPRVRPTTPSDAAYRR